MEKIKVITVIGARPQFIKAAPLSAAFAKREDIEEILIHTGQHFDEKMSSIFFEEMKIPEPKYNLEINSLGHGAMTGRMLEKLEEVFIKEQPDWVLVFGDTNSTIAGALAAKKLHIKVAHVEAGLRSFNMQMPEEVNRILTDRISDLLFCPTDSAVRNLQHEGVKDDFILRTGDVMYDAALHFKDMVGDRPKMTNHEKYILATCHRQENTDDKNRLLEIVNGLNEVHRQTPVVMPVHPRTRNKFEGLGVEIKFDTIDPVGYLDMINLIQGSSLVVTDSGGLQKEAYFFEKNCVTMRDQTEWVELVDNGYNVLTGASAKKITQSVQEMSEKNNNFSTFLYGDGTTSDRIVNELLK